MGKKIGFNFCLWIKKTPANGGRFFVSIYKIILLRSLHVSRG